MECPEGMHHLGVVILTKLAVITNPKAISNYNNYKVINYILNTSSKTHMDINFMVKTKDNNTDFCGQLRHKLGSLVLINHKPFTIYIRLDS